MKPASAVRIERVSEVGSPAWRAAIAIYREVFPTWEREPESLLARRAKTGEYLLHAALGERGEVEGFLTLHACPREGYALVTFVGVRPDRQGQGIGSALFRQAMETFDLSTGAPWLLVEAEDRAARLYGRLGMWKLDAPYSVPRYGSRDSTPMHLLAYTKGDRPPTVAGEWLRRVIEHVYAHGYCLAPDDPRIAAELAAIPCPVPVLAWPPEEP
ncbi:MAG: GNAT family N-acetyltransferase [Planctomycetes bacterium]|nr:GNAT family N-acetyltransferase [Planctomycetota bacterium]